MATSVDELSFMPVFSAGIGRGISQEVGSKGTVCYQVGLLTRIPPMKLAGYFLLFLWNGDVHFYVP